MSRQVTSDLFKHVQKKIQISIQIMLWLDKMDHMTQLARQMQITGWTLNDDWSNVITWPATPSLPVAKNRQCWPTDLVNEAKKADLQKYIFDVTKWEKSFKIIGMSK